MSRKLSAAEHKLRGTFQPYRHQPKVAPKTAPSSTSSIRPPANVKADPIALAEFKFQAKQLREIGDLAGFVSALADYALLFSRWKKASDLVQEQGLTIVQTSQTRTGRTDKIVPNPVCKLEAMYDRRRQSALTKLKLAVTKAAKAAKADTEETETEQTDFINTWLDNHADDPELLYLGCVEQQPPK